MAPTALVFEPREMVQPDTLMRAGCTGTPEAVAASASVSPFVPNVAKMYIDEVQLPGGRVAIAVPIVREPVTSTPRNTTSPSL